tara:strand:+ start:584 stop:805 length:222 start_codon:yes stop_codon:yes gene_type:complete
VRGQIGLVHSTIRSLFHGTRKNRRYTERYELIRDIDPNMDVRLHPDGCWEWASDKPELHAAVRSYFIDRQEDS